MRGKIGESNPGSSVTNERDKLMWLIVKRNRCVEGEITGVANEISLERIKGGVKVGEERFKEPTIRVEDTMETLDQKEVEPALTVVNERFARFLTRFTRSRGSMTKGRVTSSNSNAAKNSVTVRLM